MKHFKSFLSWSSLALGSLSVLISSPAFAALESFRMIVEGDDWITWVADFSFDTDDFTDPNSFNAPLQSFSAFSFDADLNLLGLITSEDLGASGFVGNQLDSQGNLFGQVSLGSSNVIDPSLNPTGQDLLMNWNWDAFTSSKLDDSQGREAGISGAGTNTFSPNGVVFAGPCAFLTPPDFDDIVPDLGTPPEFDRKIDDLKDAIVDFRRTKTPEPSLLVALGATLGLGLTLKKQSSKKS